MAKYSYTVKDDGSEIIKGEAFSYIDWGYHPIGEDDDDDES